MKPTISVIIPALNEEYNIKPTVEEVLSAIDGEFSDYEILIFDDCSTDNTGKVADELAQENRKIKVVHNKTNMGLGYNYRKGVELAGKDFITLIPGDNQIPGGSIKKMFNHINEADVIIPYIENYRLRPLSRQFTSRTFTLIMNLLFGLDLNYYNGTVIHRREIIKSVPMSSNGFAYQAEVLVKLIKAGYSFVEVGVPIREREYGGSKAFSTRNILSVLKSILRLYYGVYIKRDTVEKVIGKK